MCFEQVPLFYWLFLILFIGSFGINGHLIEQFIEVETTNGRVRGVRTTTLLRDLPFYSFKGIPYAKSPIGDLRFKVRNLS